MEKNYRKPTLGVILLGVVSCVVVAVCFLTNPEDEVQSVEEVEENYFQNESEESSGEDVSGSMENEETIVGSDVLTVASIPSTEIYEFQVTDGNTGEVKSFSMLDSNNGYPDLLNYYEKLSFVDDDSLSERSGYPYFLKICDVDGNVLQSIIAYKDAVQVDGKIYRCEDDSSTNLMLYMDLIFHPADMTSIVDEVSMAFSKLNADGGTLKLTNATEKDLTFGEDYKLYVWEDGDWQEYPVKDDKNYAFNSIGIMLDAGKTVDWDVNWSIMHGTLPKGRYKIEKSILDGSAPGDLKKYYVSCQFIIQPSE